MWDPKAEASSQREVSWEGVVHASPIRKDVPKQGARLLEADVREDADATLISGKQPMIFGGDSHPLKLLVAFFCPGVASKLRLSASRQFYYTWHLAATMVQ